MDVTNDNVGLKKKSFNIFNAFVRHLYQYRGVIRVKCIFYIRVYSSVRVHVGKHSL